MRRCGHKAGAVHVSYGIHGPCMDDAWNSCPCSHTMLLLQNGTLHLSIARAARFSPTNPFISHKHALRTHLGLSSPGPLYTSPINTIAHDTQHRSPTHRYTAPHGDHTRHIPHIDRSAWLFMHNEKRVGEGGEIKAENRIVHELCSPGPAAYATQSDFPRTYEQVSRRSAYVCGVGTC